MFVVTAHTNKPVHRTQFVMRSTAAWQADKWRDQGYTVTIDCVDEQPFNERYEYPLT